MCNKILSVTIMVLLALTSILWWQNVNLNKKIEINEKIIDEMEEIIDNTKDENNICIPYKKDMGMHELTFYTHTGNNTASGKYPQANRTIAVDKTKIPLGSIVYIDGYGIRIAEDTGGDIKNKRIDVFVDTHKQAIQNGRKKAKVYLLHK